MPGRHAARRESSPRPYLIAGLVVLALIVATRFLVGGGQLAAGGGEPCTTLTIASSPDKTALLQELATDYASTRPEVGGRCVKVTVAAKEHQAALNALGRGWDPEVDGPRPDVWAPSSTMWVRLLEARRATAGGADIVPDEAPPIATSPLVVAMPRPLAEGLGWPERQPKWADLLGLAVDLPGEDAKGWAKAGKPELGEFKLGVPDAFSATAGLSAHLGSWYVAVGRVLGRPSPPTPQLMGNREVRSLVYAFDSAIDERPESSADLLAGMLAADDKGQAVQHLHALVVEEKSVLDYNQGNPSGDPAALGKHGRPKVPLAAIYPQEGTVVSDHPWVVLNAPWVDQAKRQVAADLLAYLRGQPAQARFQQAGFRDHQGGAGPLATPENGLLGTERPQPLPVPDVKLASAMFEAYSQMQKPANILSVFDVSGSMKAPVPGTPYTRMELVAQAATQAITYFDNNVKIGSWVFSSNLDGQRDYREIVPYGVISEEVQPGMTRRELLRARQASMEATSGDTALYDTTWAAWEFMKKRAEPGDINVVVLLTDGRNDDPNGGLSLDELLTRLRQQADGQVRIIIIGVGDEVDDNALNAIAEASKGKYHPVRDPRDILRVVLSAVASF